MQRALKLYLDGTDGRDEVHEYMPVVLKAQNLLLEAIAYYRDVKNTRKIADQLETLSDIAFRFDLDRGAARTQLIEAADLYVGLGAFREARDALTTLIVQDPSNKDRYLAMLDAVHAEVGPEATLQELVSRAEAFEAAGESARAMGIYVEVADAYTASGDVRRAAETFLYLAEISDLLEDDALTKVHYQKALALSKACDCADTHAMAIVGLIEIAEVEGGQDIDALIEDLEALKGRVSSDTEETIELYLGL